jgi:hypothetical protein
MSASLENPDCWPHRSGLVQAATHIGLADNHFMHVSKPTKACGGIWRWSMWSTILRTVLLDLAQRVYNEALTIEDEAHQEVRAAIGSG